MGFQPRMVPAESAHKVIKCCFSCSSAAVDIISTGIQSPAVLLRQLSLKKNYMHTLGSESDKNNK